MNHLAKNMRMKLAWKLPPTAIKKWELLGLSKGFMDEFFWRTYCIIRCIIAGPWDESQNKPWETRARLWMNRVPIWTPLEETPWDPGSQSPKYFWGSDLQCVIDYEQSATAKSIIDNHTSYLVKRSIADEAGGFITTNIGFYQVAIIDNLAYYVLYCPYDQISVGFGNEQTIRIDYSSKYVGETKNGLRQGDGVLAFTNGFMLSTEFLTYCWNDANIIGNNTGKNYEIPGASLPFIEQIEDILNLFIHWCKQTDYVNIMFKTRK